MIIYHIPFFCLSVCMYVCMYVVRRREGVYGAAISLTSDFSVATVVCAVHATLLLMMAITYQAAVNSKVTLTPILTLTLTLTC